MRSLNEIKADFEDFKTLFYFIFVVKAFVALDATKSLNVNKRMCIE